MTAKRYFTAGDVIAARSAITGLTVDELLAAGYINIPAVLAGDDGQTWGIVLESPPERVIQTIKVVREITGLGLAEAKRLVDHAPCLIIDGLVRADAERYRRQLMDEAGASASLRRDAR